MKAWRNHTTQNTVDPGAERGGGGGGGRPRHLAVGGRQRGRGSGAVEPVNPAEHGINSAGGVEEVRAVRGPRTPAVQEQKKGACRGR